MNNLNYFYFDSDNFSYAIDTYLEMHRDDFSTKTTGQLVTEFLLSEPKRGFADVCNYADPISTNIVRGFYEDGSEITDVVVGNGVIFYDTDGTEREGFIVNVDEDSWECTVSFYDKTACDVTVDIDCVDVIHEDILPKYQFMYVIKDDITDRARFMSALCNNGFRIFEVDDLGYVFGFDAPAIGGTPTQQMFDDAFATAIKEFMDAGTSE